MTDISVREVIPDADPRLVERFVSYHRRHPQVWKLFIRYARQMRDGGNRKRYSAWAIINRIRWDHDMEKTEVFKIANQYIAVYARLAMHVYPEFEGFFDLRPMKSHTTMPEDYGDGMVPCSRR